MGLSKNWPSSGGRRPALLGSVPCLRRTGVTLGFGFIVTACGTGHGAPDDVSFDRIDLVARWRLEPGSSMGEYASTEDLAGVWVEAFLEPDRGWGIFKAEGGTRVSVPEDDAGELHFEDFRLRLTTDDYTQSGWLNGAHLVLQGTGKASLEERRDEYGSSWLVTDMPLLVLIDATRSIRGEFDWVEEPATPELATTIWLRTEPSASHFYLHFARFRLVSAEEPAP